jgi:hypothetical protein
VYGFDTTLDYRPTRANDVPRIAAALASLLLVASSIGVNIARYPTVGQTVGGAAPVALSASTAPTPVAQAVAPARPAATAKPTAPPALPEKPAVAVVSSPPAKPVSAKPAAVATPPKKPATTVADSSVPTGHILAVHPLVPSNPFSARAEASPPATAAEMVVRLPPVDPAAPIDDAASTSNADPPSPYLVTDTP